MSRRLGANYMRKARIQQTGIEQQGRDAFKAGVLIGGCPYLESEHGKSHVWKRGWRRERDRK